MAPADEGLKGAGPDEPPARSQGFGGGLLAAKLRTQFNFQEYQMKLIDNIILTEPSDEINN